MQSTANTSAQIPKEYPSDTSGPAGLCSSAEQRLLTDDILEYLRRDDNLTSLAEALRADERLVADRLKTLDESQMHLCRQGMELRRDVQLGDIQKTALLALAMRADEASRTNPRIKDEKAAEILAALEVNYDDLARELGFDLKGYDLFLSHECIVARAIMFGETLRKLIAQYPDAACINLGCGLDDKFSQVDNGAIEWFDVDLPDQIELRRHFFQDRPRCTMVCGDALDGTWTACVPKDRMAIICMEGVLEYFTKEQTATCLHTLRDSFEHGYLVAEMNSMAMVEHARKHGSTLGDGEAPFKWGTTSGQEFVALEPRMRLLSEHSYNEEIRKHSERGRFFADSPYRDLNNRIAVFSW